MGQHELFADDGSLGIGVRDVQQEYHGERSEEMVAGSRAGWVEMMECHFFMLKLCTLARNHFSEG
jgi:hypothetical protein